MTTNFASGRLLVVAFEGWNDAGEAASGAARMLKDELELEPIGAMDPEDYFDYQFNRPTVAIDDEGTRQIVWPEVTAYGPVSTDESNVYVVLGSEPSRGWKMFATEFLEIVEDAEITGVIFLGAMLADVPHTRPISVFLSSENPDVRTELEVERSSYEGPVGILAVLAQALEKANIPTLSVWASVPHYVHNAPSPKATLALVQKLEGIIGVTIPRGELVEESVAWESGIDALASDDDDMAAYIAQLERARDTVDSPEASGDAIAEEFEKYLRKRDGRAGPSTGE